MPATAERPASRECPGEHRRRVLTPARRIATTLAAGVQIPPGTYFASIEIISAWSAIRYGTRMSYDLRIRRQPSTEHRASTRQDPERDREFGRAHFTERGPASSRRAWRSRGSRAGSSAAAEPCRDRRRRTKARTRLTTAARPGRAPRPRARWQDRLPRAGSGTAPGARRPPPVSTSRNLEARVARLALAGELGDDAGVQAVLDARELELGGTVRPAATARYSAALTLARPMSSAPVTRGPPGTSRGVRGSAQGLPREPPSHQGSASGPVPRAAARAPPAPVAAALRRFAPGPPRAGAVVLPVARTPSLCPLRRALRLPRCSPPPPSASVSATVAAQVGPISLLCIARCSGARSSSESRVRPARP